MSMRQEIHEKWAEITDNGSADSRVQDCERLFEDLATQVRARYNTPSSVLAKIDTCRQEAADAIKRSIVIQWSAQEARAMRSQDEPREVTPQAFIDELQGVGHMAVVELGGKRATFHVTAWSKGGAGSTFDYALTLKPEPR